MAGKFLIALKNRTAVTRIEKALKEDRHQVVCAPNGIAAVDLALDRKPNAIFLGVSLKGLDGLDVARALRSLAPTLNVPIIFLAENPDEAKRVADARMPLTECLTAPYDLAELKTHAVGGWHTGAHVADLRPAKTENGWMLAILDPLTHLYHRRYLLHRLAYESKRSMRYKTPLAVLLVDVDNLKEINRQHGILIGDAVLIELGQLLLKMMRRSEIIGRCDAQDFLAVLPHTGETGARVLAERICRMVAAHHFVSEKMDLRVTASAGVAWTSGDDLAESLALLGRAEVALSRAKRAGKNRIEVG